MNSLLKVKMRDESFHRVSNLVHPNWSKITIHFAIKFNIDEPTMAAASQGPFSLVTMRHSYMAIVKHWTRIVGKMITLR